MNHVNPETCLKIVSLLSRKISWTWQMKEEMVSFCFSVIEKRERGGWSEGGKVHPRRGHEGPEVE
jgi:hypothetical protein